MHASLGDLLAITWQVDLHLLSQQLLFSHSLPLFVE